MKKLIVASNNEHKVREIKQILSNFNIDVVSLKDSGIDIEVEEDGNTFMENAYKKAIEIYKITNKDMVLADDSGLMVDALGGAPGIYSARFSGEYGNYKKNNEKLIYLMQGKSIDERKARFVTALVLILDENKHIEVTGEIEGYIIDEKKGNEGFGYDPLFFVPEYNKTFAEMEPEIKNKISHRARALEKLKMELKEILQED